jgi:1,4-dihydroxy-6-naphthoate synthase
MESMSGAEHRPSAEYRRLQLGFSPCPNDTFIFHALVHGQVTVPGIGFEVTLADVEQLNQLALRGVPDVVKVSYGALPYLLDEYVLLRSGGALGRGCGPLIVACRPLSPSDLRNARIAIPGRYTTANLLLQLQNPDARPGIAMPYDRIMPAVEAGEVDAGLIIHESRFTYQDHGLVQVADLGAWWESVTGAPIPLGAIIARRSLGPAVGAIEAAIRSSIEHAHSAPEASAEYVRDHAQEMSPEVARQHIELYVTRFSVDLGAEGELAVRTLVERAVSAGLLPFGTPDPLGR